MRFSYFLNDWDGFTAFLTDGRICLTNNAAERELRGVARGRKAWLFFHGCYDSYCYLPLYIFCGRHLLAAKLRRSNIDGAAGAREEVERIIAQIRRSWPRTRIIAGAADAASSARQR